MLDFLQQGLDDATEETALAAALQAQDRGLQSEGLDRLAAALAPFLRAMPAALKDAFAMAEHPEAATQGLDRAIGFATGQVLRYLFDERDLLPERDFAICGAWRATTRTCCPTRRSMRPRTPKPWPWCAACCRPAPPMLWSAAPST